MRVKDFRVEWGILPIAGAKTMLVGKVEIPIAQIACNEGLSEEDFWDLYESRSGSRIAIIQLTDFMYSNIPDNKIQSAPES
ncbi:hypothetical protein IR022_08445 [Dysgonomonas sp. GY617]|nr:hypothetical protein [Dysgonomonas sp. GY617]